MRAFFYDKTHRNNDIISIIYIIFLSGNILISEKGIWYSNLTTGGVVMSKLSQAELEQQERELEEQLRQLELESQELELLEQELEEAQEFEGSESRFAEEKDVVVPTAPIYDFTSTKTIKKVVCKLIKLAPNFV